MSIFVICTGSVNGVQLINRCLPQLFGLYIDKVISRLTPVQRLGPPILMGADTVKTVARVPEVADHWIASRRHSKSFLPEALPEYKAALERQGKPYRGLIIFRDLCIADTTREAEERIREGYERRYRRYRNGDSRASARI